MVSAILQKLLKKDWNICSSFHSVHLLGERSMNVNQSWFQALKTAREILKMSVFPNDGQFSDVRGPIILNNL